MEGLKEILLGLVAGVRAVSSIMLLMFVVIFLYAIAGRIFFGENDPVHFGSVAIGMLSLFQANERSFPLKFKVRSEPSINPNQSPNRTERGFCVDKGKRRGAQQCVCRSRAHASRVCGSCRFAVRARASLSRSQRSRHGRRCTASTTLGATATRRASTSRSRSARRWRRATTASSSPPTTTRTSSTRLRRTGARTGLWAA